MHAANHPETRHLCQSVWAVDPNAAAWLDRVNQDGSVEPILFREMVGQ
jgi:hypothetical protein